MTTVIDRPTPKSVGKAAYERYRRKQMAYGRWDRFTDPEPVRQHILALRRNGVGRDVLARAAGVNDSHISKIVCRRITKLTVEVAEQILAVTDPKPFLVDATGARRRLQALGALGWDQSTLAPRIGWQVGALNLIVSGRRTRIAQTTNERISQLYDELSGTVAPDSYRARRALMAAKRNGWVSPLAWDDDTIDDPTAEPNTGDQTEATTDHDPITVALAVDGRLTYEQLNAHRPDLIEAVRRLATRMTDIEIAHHLRWPRAAAGPDGKSRGQEAVCKLRNREGIPGPEKYEAVYAYGTRSRARTKQAA